MTTARAHVALLVDFANVRQQLSGETDSAAAIGGRAIATALVQYAAGVGRVGIAQAYADWSRDPELSRELSGTRLVPVLVPATEDGEDRSHIRLAIDAMAALYNGDEPDAFVLVTSDASLVPLVQALRSDGSEVSVIAAAGPSSDELRAEADHFDTLEDVLAGKTGTALAMRPTIERGASAPERSQAPRSDMRESREPRDKPRYDRPLLTEANFEGYDWSGFITLLDELEQRLPFVGVRYLVNKVLGPHNCGIDDPRIKRDLMNEAVDEGILEMYTVGNVNERTDPVTACRLDRHNEVVRTILLEAAAAAAAEAEAGEQEGDEADEYDHASAGR